MENTFWLVFERKSEEFVMHRATTLSATEVAEDTTHETFTLSLASSINLSHDKKFFLKAPTTKTNEFKYVSKLIFKIFHSKLFQKY